jgi:hypothetical protein
MAKGGAMSVEFEIEAVQGTAYWRSQKAAEFPDDARNAEAERVLLSIAESLKGIRESPKAKIFERFHDLIFAGTETDNPSEVSRLWDEYRREIGFRRFPDSGEEYLDDLMALAREV